MKRFLLAVAALVAIGSVTAVFADGEWLRVGPVWLKGLVYTGTSKVALTNATGNLSTTSGAFSGAVSAGSATITGAMSVSGITNTGNISTSGNSTVNGTLAVTGATTLRDQVTMADEVSVTDLTAGATADAGSVQGSGILTVTAVQATTVGTAGDCFTLPVPAAGLLEIVCNGAAANAMDLFPNSGAQINKESANTAISLAAGECAFCLAFSATRWGCTIGSAN